VPLLAAVCAWVLFRVAVDKMRGAFRLTRIAMREIGSEG